MADRTPERPLPAQARQQLLTIAADVMSRTPVADLPPALRRFARFAPAKRLRLGASEIATSLAVDEPFRHTVAQVVAETSPELAQQIQAGTPPETADPIDVAVITYLLRPAGWVELLDAIGARLDAQDLRRGTDAELVRLRGEVDRLAETNRALQAERDQARAAARSAAAGQADELAELRRQLRSVQAELRLAHRGAERATEELERVRADHEQQRTGEAAELRRARNRVADLEAELETARRVARSDRDHDSARLWLLLETIGSAVSGLRRELAVSAPDVRPADLVSSGDVVAAGRPSTADGPLLDRLLEAGSLHLIVDGYNLTKTGYGTLALAEQRSRLIGSLGPLAARTGAEVTVAFDGTAAPVGVATAVPAPRGVRVLFSANGQLADDLIRELLRAEPAGRLVAVASSDQEVAASARAAGAWPVPAAVLLSRLER
ncbi:MAG TPA: NYN domain-containing protein [Jatrophihabitans sp.]|nr:NYN domain-containing protein [Jatrophihabitans sp.]